jgi:Flp pilus assembly pilin Flp
MFCRKIIELMGSEGGPTATEYAVLIAVICIGVIAALSSFGVHMDNIYMSLAGTMPSPGGS